MKATSIPVKTFGDFFITFTAEPEDRNMRSHFLDDCGWSKAQFSKIKDFAWFCAKVSIVHKGEEIATDYLGGCCYKSPKDFYTVYEGDYFTDMVHNCALSLKNRYPDLLKEVTSYHEGFRK